MLVPSHTSAQVTLGHPVLPMASISSVLIFFTTLASLRLPPECTRPRQASPASSQALPLQQRSRALVWRGSQKEGGMGGAVPWGPRLHAQGTFSLAKDWRCSFRLVGRRGLGERKGGLPLERLGLPCGQRERAPGGGDARAHDCSMTNRLGTAGVRPQDGAGRA